MKKIEPRNLTAQLNYRARGNPASSLPDSAISNCFPGLEFDFRNMWRRIFEGIVLSESSNYVVAAEDTRYEHLCKHRLLRVDGHALVVTVSGPQMPGGAPVLLTSAQNPSAIAFMEWSNSIARLLSKQGKAVRCEFTLNESPGDAPIPSDPGQVIVEELTVRHLFEQEGQQTSAVIAKALLKPGELTQGLCSPWQNDYRECACYYWAASRPDYVNVEPGQDGMSHGDNWMSKRRTGEYVPDNRVDTRLHSYDDLFREWQRLLRFQIKGRDAEAAPREAEARRKPDGSGS